ncbi:hypothetical protein BAUCODRAFT_38545 [Baudoinia panamericana UAMH 10762]|uniref:Uncharacterized protein n=1 Tax=Baudoinia panamericana (strain UAMH 10762) TaxID=717646 RepID=M2N1G5_BAUPA|nr:uncharacterized protein BAUCODRAFT_38545 [Baudoinia panamericana UAMH 10762]EMC92475.1 hypothetical protein BAUCODRAFT_38545 [Baudoinia panamericana UAMH 10762]
MAIISTVTSGKAHRILQPARARECKLQAAKRNTRARERADGGSGLMAKLRCSNHPRAVPGQPVVEPHPIERPPFAALLCSGEEPEPPVGLRVEACLAGCDLDCCS